MSYERIPLDQFQDVFGATSTGEASYLSASWLIFADGAGCEEISSVALGGRAVRWSDEFFAEASNLLKVEVCLFPVGVAEATPERSPYLSPRYHTKARSSRPEPFSTAGRPVVTTRGATGVSYASEPRPATLWGSTSTPPTLAETRLLRPLSKPCSLSHEKSPRQMIRA